MRHGIHQGMVGVLLAAVALQLAPSAAAEQKIKLKGLKEFSADVMGRNGDSVVMRVPRTAVETIDGQPLPPPVAAGVKAPAFSVVDLDGVTQALPDKNSKATVVVFWATWCPHCRSDVPLLKDLATKYADKGLRILAVSIDRDVEKLKQFVAQEQLPYPVIASEGPGISPEQAALPDRYENQGVPGYIIVDGKGLITKTLSGSVTEGKVDLEGHIRSLLGIASTARASSTSAIR